MDKRAVGLYAKYQAIERTDGQSAPGGKHHGCDYFVLDLTHDPHARPALLAYADSCEAEYPLLARDLRAKLPALPAPPAETPTSFPRMIRPREAARLIGLSVPTILRLRARGEFPQPIRLTRRAVGWPEDVLRAWLEARAQKVCT